MTKIQICFFIFKKVIFDGKNSDLFCLLYVLQRMKKTFFKKRVSLIVQIYAIMN